MSEQRPSNGENGQSDARDGAGEVLGQRSLPDSRHELYAIIHSSGVKVVTAYLMAGYVGKTPGHISRRPDVRARVAYLQNQPIATVDEVSVVCTTIMRDPRCTASQRLSAAREVASILGLHTRQGRRMDGDAKELKAKDRTESDQRLAAIAAVEAARESEAPE